jgi:hypothetical protein
VQPLEKLSDRHQRIWGIVTHLKVRALQGVAQRALRDAAHAALLALLPGRCRQGGGGRGGGGGGGGRGGPGRRGRRGGAPAPPPPPPPPRTRAPPDPPPAANPTLGPRWHAR